MNRLASTTVPADRSRSPTRVHVLGFTGDDAALHTALVQGHPGAPAALFDRYGEHVHRVLANVLGIDSELPDLLHEVFARALRNVQQLDDGDKLKSWLSRIAVFTARGCIRSRVRRRWLRILAPGDVPEITVPTAAHEAREALQATYAVLRRMKTEHRIVFALRFIQGMSLSEAAQASDMSLATFKRRLGQAEDRFVRLAQREPALASWLQEGGPMVQPVDRLRELGRLVDSTWDRDPGRDERLAVARARLIGRTAALDTLGRTLDAAHEHISSEQNTLGEVRGRLLSRPRRDAGWRRPRSWLDAPVRPALLAAALVAAGIIAVIAQRANTPNELIFSDGSEVRLMPGASAGVTTMAPDSAVVALQQGELDVHIVPGGPRRWTFAAGPFAVEVVGTRFAVAWDPDEQRFAVRLAGGQGQGAGATHRIAHAGGRR